MSASINISSQSSRGSARSARFKRGRIVLPAKRRRITLPPRTTIVKFVARPTGEKKFFDLSFAEVTTTAWANIGSVFPVPTKGTDDQNRIGSKISIVSVHVNHFLSQTAAEAQAAPSPEVTTRLVMGVTKSGALPGVGQIMDVGATTQLIGFRQLNDTDNFRVIKDWYSRSDPKALNEGAANAFAHGTSISQVTSWTHVFKKPLVMKFSSAADTVDANGLFLQAVSTLAGATNNIEIRVRYMDS